MSTISNHFISLDQAVAMTTKYRNNKDLILQPPFASEGILPISESFSRDAFDALLAQAGCVGIRFYYSMDDSLHFHIIAVGFDVQDRDILPTDSTVVNTNVGVVVEESRICPPDCASSSPLNP